MRLGDRQALRPGFGVRDHRLAAAFQDDRRFRRLWELYLRYCEAGFMERRITDVQALFAKPGYRVNMRPLMASSRKAGPRDASLASASRPPGPTM